MPARPTKTPISNLGNDINKGGKNGGADGNDADGVATIAGTEKVRDGVFTKAAQVGGKQEGDQYKSAGPADNIGQALKAREVKRSGQTDEGSGAHPVGTGGHTVEKGRDAPAGYVIFRDVGGTTDDADGGIHENGEEEEGVADPAWRHAMLFEHRQPCNKGEKTTGVVEVVTLDPG